MSACVNAGDRHALRNLRGNYCIAVNPTSFLWSETPIDIREAKIIPRVIVVDKSSSSAASPPNVAIAIPVLVAVAVVLVIAAIVHNSRDHMIRQSHGIRIRVRDLPVQNKTPTVLSPLPQYFLLLIHVYCYRCWSVSSSSPSL